jgi:hypothetical protein
MPAQEEVVGFCATYYGVFEIRSSDGETLYEVNPDANNGGCSCKGWEYRQKCRHMERVWEEACLYNPQWKDPGPGTLEPVRYLRPGDHYGECPGCGGPLVPVRIAV